MLNACASPAFVVTFKFQVFIYLQHILKLLLGWLANSKELIVASQTVHTVEWTLHTTITMTLGREENSKIRIWKEELDLTYFSWNFFQLINYGTHLGHCPLLVDNNIIIFLTLLFQALNKMLTACVYGIILFTSSAH